MLDFSFGEMLVIAIIAVIFLGPDKLPQAFINVAKFFKSIKKIINDAKDTLNKEIRIDEIRNEAIEYKKKFDEGTNKLSNSIKDDIDFGISNTNSILNTDIDYESTTKNLPRRKETKKSIEVTNKRAINNLKQKTSKKEKADRVIEENLDSKVEKSKKISKTTQNSNKTTLKSRGKKDNNV